MTSGKVKRKPYRILIAEPDRFHPEAVRRLSEVAEVDLRPVDGAELQAALSSYDVVWLRLASRITREMLDGAIRCCIIANPVTGLDHIDLEACAEKGISVVSLKGETMFLDRVRATAELALGLALALIRKLPQAARSVEEGTWNRDLFQGNELFEKTAGIVGVGRLGRITADYFRALGMHVLGYDPRADFPNDSAERVASLQELLRRSDLVSLHATYNEATHHLIGREEFAAMKRGAFLVNTARGGLIDEAALLHALRSGQLAGAALDVLQGEPDIGTDHPLVAYAREHDNLLIVPHLGGNTVESWEKTEVFLADRVVEKLLEVENHPTNR